MSSHQLIICGLRSFLNSQSMSPAAKCFNHILTQLVTYVCQCIFWSWIFFSEKDIKKQKMSSYELVLFIKVHYNTHRYCVFIITICTYKLCVVQPVEVVICIFCFSLNVRFPRNHMGVYTPSAV